MFTFRRNTVRNIIRQRVEIRTNIMSGQGLDKLRTRYRCDALERANPLRRTQFFGRAHFAS